MQKFVCKNLLTTEQKRDKMEFIFKVQQRRRGPIWPLMTILWLKLYSIWNIYQTLTFEIDISTEILSLYLYTKLRHCNHAHIIIKYIILQESKVLKLFSLMFAYSNRQ